MKYRCVLGLFSLQTRILDACHGVEVLPTCDLARLRVSLHRNLLERAMAGRLGAHGTRTWVAESHIIITVAAASLQIADTDEAHLAVAFAVLARALITAILADLRTAVAVGAELELWENVLGIRARAILLPGLVLGSTWCSIWLRLYISSCFKRSGTARCALLFSHFDGSSK